MKKPQGSPFSFFNEIEGGDNLSEENMRMLLKLAEAKREVLSGGQPILLILASDLATMAVAGLAAWLIGGHMILSDMIAKLL